MQTIILPTDITVFYITAVSFPQGIAAAHDALHKLIPFTTQRKFFGISRPENGKIVYRAATEEIETGEAERLHCPTLVIKKGKYLCLTIEDYTIDMQSIDKAFKEILSQPGLDPQGYCVEWYLTQKKVNCMVRLEQ